MSRKIMTFPITKSVLLSITKIVALTDENISPFGEPLPRDYEIMSREELHKRLKIFIAELLDSNFEKLCNMMYRHDVIESRFKEALDAPTFDEQADMLADAVIDREMEKVATRLAYRKSRPEKNKQIED